MFSTRAGLRERPVPTAEQTNGLWGGAHGDYGSDRGTRPKHDERGTLRHLCIVAWHRVRMVRFLPVRDPRTILRFAVLPARERDRSPALGIRDLRGRLPGAPVRCRHLRPY